MLKVDLKKLRLYNANLYRYFSNDDAYLHPFFYFFYSKSKSGVPIILKNSEQSHWLEVPYTFILKDDSLKELEHLYKLITSKYIFYKSDENHNIVQCKYEGSNIDTYIILSPTGNCQIASIGYLKSLKAYLDFFANKEQLSAFQKNHMFSFFMLYATASVNYFKRMFYFDHKMSDEHESELFGVSKVVTSSKITTTNGSKMTTGIVLC